MGLLAIHCKNKAVIENNSKLFEKEFFSKRVKFLKYR